MTRALGILLAFFWAYYALRLTVAYDLYACLIPLAWVAWLGWRDPASAIIVSVCCALLFSQFPPDLNVFHSRSFEAVLSGTVAILLVLRIVRAGPLSLRVGRLVGPSLKLWPRKP